MRAKRAGQPTRAGSPALTPKHAGMVNAAWGKSLEDIFAWNKFMNEWRAYPVTPELIELARQSAEFWGTMAKEWSKRLHAQEAEAKRTG